MAQHRQSIEDFERRAHRRFPMRVPVLFKNESEHGERVAGGFTNDVSVSGVYVLCEAPDRPVIGDRIAVELLMPPFEEGAGPSIRMKSVGRVLRLNASVAACGFAMAAWFGSEEPVNGLVVDR